jgi:hypothetical protein
MDKLFDSDTNPLAGIILAAMIQYGEKLLDEENILYLYSEIYEYLTIIIGNIDDINYLNFDIISDKNIDFIEIKPKNLTTALWFCGIFPKDCKRVEEREKYIHLEKEYSLNKKFNTLKINII